MINTEQLLTSLHDETDTSLNACCVHQQGAGLPTSLGHMLHFSVIQQERQVNEEEEEEEGEQQTSMSSVCLYEQWGGLMQVALSPPISLVSYWAKGGVGRGAAQRSVGATHVKATHGLKKVGRRCCGLTAEINNMLLAASVQHTQH